MVSASDFILPQPYSDDLQAIAELTTDAFGRQLLCLPMVQIFARTLGL